VADVPVLPQTPSRGLIRESVGSATRRTPSTGGQGVRVRFTPIKGETPHAVLARALYLPALLGDWQISEDGAHNDYETVRHGEFSSRRFGSRRDMRMLRTLDMEALTLYWRATWAHPSYQRPDWIEKKLYMILRARCPVLMLVRLKQDGWDDILVRMNVTFRSVQMSVKHGEPDTKYWSIQLKEWRHTGTGRRGHGVGKVKLPTTHRLKRTDTLQSLAKKYYGSGHGWAAIAKRNGIKKWGMTSHIVNMSRFKVGSRIKIPKKPTKANTQPTKPGGKGSSGGATAPSSFNRED
jgi:hypothetical protein